MPRDVLPNEQHRADYRRAAELLRKRGHAKNILEDFRDRSLCLYGALITARFGNSTTHTDAVLWQDWAHGLGFSDAKTAVTWNNAPERTAGEVIELLETKAKEPEYAS